MKGSEGQRRPDKSHLWVGTTAVKGLQVLSNRNMGEERVKRKTMKQIIMCTENIEEDVKRLMKKTINAERYFDGMMEAVKGKLNL